MSSKGEVILISPDAETVDAVSAALNGSGELRLAEVFRDLPHLAKRLHANSAQAVLVDLGPNPARTLGELAQVTERFPDVRFVVLSETVSNELIFDAMAVGARYFLLKSSIASELQGILARLAMASSTVDEKELGRLVTFLSAGGGCGATTLAINLANELRLESSEPVLLVDMDCAYGAVGVYLELDYSYGLVDVLEHEGSIDADLVKSSATSYGEGLHVLLSPAGAVGHGRSVRWDQIDDFLKACRTAYRHVVVDAPRVPMEVATDLALASEMALLVMQLNVKDVRVAKSQLEALMQRGVHGGQIVPLVNRYRKRNPMVSIEQGAAALGMSKLDCVSNDFRSAVRGMNYGQPLADIAPRSSLRQDVRQLALRVCSKSGTTG